MQMRCWQGSCLNVRGQRPKQDTATRGPREAALVRPRVFRRMTEDHLIRSFLGVWWRSVHVKASWMPAAEEYRHALGRQASEKARGRKPRAGRAPAVRHVHVMGI